MGKSGTCHQSENSYNRVCISLSGKNELAHRAATEKNAGKTDKIHTKCVPQSVRVCDWLTCESRIKECGTCHSSENQVHNKCTYKNCHKSEEQFVLTKQNCITDTANHTEAGSLCNDTNDHTCCQRYQNCRMFCSRTAFRLCKVNKYRSSHQKNQHYNLERRINSTFQFRHLVRTFQSVAFFQEKCSCQNTTYKTGQTEDGISVTTSQTQDHTERASKEHQTADHSKCTQCKSRDRCRTTAWTKFFCDQ